MESGCVRDLNLLARPSSSVRQSHARICLSTRGGRRLGSSSSSTRWLVLVVGSKRPAAGALRHDLADVICAVVHRDLDPVVLRPQLERRLEVRVRVRVPWAEGVLGLDIPYLIVN